MGDRGGGARGAGEYITLNDSAKKRSKSNYSEELCSFPSPFFFFLVIVGFYRVEILLCIDCKSRVMLFCLTL